MAISHEQTEETLVSFGVPDVKPVRDRSPSPGFKIPRQWLGGVLPVLLVIAWESLVRGGILAANWFPAPFTIADTLLELLQGGELARHIAYTLARVLAGFLIGALTATLLAGVTGSTPLVRWLLDPTIQALRSIPSMAWVPLFLLWMGIHESSKITLISVGGFFPVYLNLLSGILTVDRKLVEVGRVFKLDKVQLVRRVILPAALPSYLCAARSMRSFSDRKKSRLPTPFKSSSDTSRYITANHIAFYGKGGVGTSTLISNISAALVEAGFLWRSAAQRHRQRVRRGFCTTYTHPRTGAHPSLSCDGKWSGY